jgi:hypothetical protein
MRYELQTTIRERVYTSDDRVTHRLDSTRLGSTRLDSARLDSARLDSTRLLGLDSAHSARLPRLRMKEESNEDEDDFSTTENSKQHYSRELGSSETVSNQASTARSCRRS